MTWLHIIPQNLTNLTQSVRIEKALYFCDIHPCTVTINVVYTSFEAFSTFMCLLRATGKCTICNFFLHGIEPNTFLKSNFFYDVFYCS